MVRSKIEGTVSVLLTIAAVAIAVSSVRRAFFSGSLPAETRVANRPVFLASWREALPVGIRVGDTAAPVTIVEFADLECPPCRTFQSTLRNVMKAHPHDVSVVHVSYPLPIHRFALPAARGAECAYRYGRFSEWIEAVYDKQDSLGLKSWGTYAREAGIRDTLALATCVKDASPVRRIQAGVALGNKIHVRGTPTVIVNGWRLPYTPTEDELTSVVEAIASGREPFDTTGHSRR